MTSPRLGLAALVHPMEPARFITDHWPHTPLLAHGDPARFTGLLDAPELRDIPAMLAAKHKRTSLRFKSAKDGAPVALQCPPLLARDLYLAGRMTLVLDAIDQGVPIVRELLETLTRELGTPSTDQGLLGNVYVSPAGSGAGMHFDNSEVFIIQLRGRKRWQYAPNTQVLSPMHSFFVGHPAPPKLLELAASPFPSEMPADAQTVELAPGSVLFLPRGYWHNTHTLEDSVHLTLTLTSKTWSEVLLEKLSGELPRDLAWRKPAAGLTSPGAPGQEARRSLAALLGELGAQLSREASAE